VLEELPSLETFIDAVVIGTIMGSIVGVNPAAERMFGYESGELERKPLTVLMPEPFKSQHDSYLFRHEKFKSEGLLGRTRELKGQRKDGSVLSLSLSLGRLHHHGYYIASFKEL